MASEAANMVLRCVFHGSLSMHDMDIERRPYHRNCTCALHGQKSVGSGSCLQRRSASYPKKQALKLHSLSMAASKFSSRSSVPSDRSIEATCKALVRKRENLVV